MKARRPEDRLQDEIRATLGTMPGVIIMRNAVSYATRPGMTHPELFGLGKGTPDLVCIVRGHVVGLELKAARGRLSEEQARCHEAWRAAGAHVYIVKTIDQAREALEACSR